MKKNSFIYGHLCIKRKGNRKYFLTSFPQVSKGANIKNRYNQVPHLTQDTNEKVTNSQLDTTKREPGGQPFPSRWPQGTYKQTHTNA